MTEEAEPKVLVRRSILIGAGATMGGGLIYGVSQALGRLETIRAASVRAPIRYDTAHRPLVVAASYPAYWLLYRLSVDRFQLNCVQPAGTNSMEWRPPDDLLRRVESAPLIVAAGGGYEPWVGALDLPPGRLVSLLPQVGPLSEGSTQGAGQAMSLYTWTDPVLFRQQAQILAQALETFLPEGAAEFRSNMRLLKIDLDNLIREYRSAMTLNSGIRLAASAPVYGFLARRLGLDIEAFSFSAEVAPSGRSLRAYQDWVYGQISPTLLWHAPPSQQVIAAFPDAVRHQFLDPLDTPRTQEPVAHFDYLKQSRQNVAVLRSIFGG